jgi:hypothetical protein
MAYRLLCGLLAVLWAAPSRAAPHRIALIVDGGGDRHDELCAALSKALDAQLATTAARPTDETGLQALRTSLEAARLVIVRAEARGSDRFTLTVDAIDAAGVSHRSGDGTADGLIAAAQELVAELPRNLSPEPPPTGAVAEPKAPAPPIQQVYRRRHPYGLLIAGAVTFLLPYFTTVGFAVNYESYNANAARVGYIPLAGPFLARQRMNDKDLKDGYDPGLLVDGIVQTLTFNLLIAGIIYCAVGEKRVEYERRAHVEPLLGVGHGEARVGAVVSW